MLSIDKLAQCGKIKIKTLEESNVIHEMLFNLGYKYPIINQTYPKVKPYGIAWFSIEGNNIIRKTNNKEIFVGYSTNEIRNIDIL